MRRIEVKLRNEYGHNREYPWKIPSDKIELLADIIRRRKRPWEPSTAKDLYILFLEEVPSKEIRIGFNIFATYGDESYLFEMKEDATKVEASWNHDNKVDTVVFIRKPLWNDI